MNENFILENCKKKINKLNNEYNIFPSYDIKILYDEEMYHECYHQIEFRYVDKYKYCHYFQDLFELVNYLDGVSLGIQYMKYKNKS